MSQYAMSNQLGDIYGQQGLRPPPPAWKPADGVKVRPVHGGFIVDAGGKEHVCVMLESVTDLLALLFKADK